MHRMVWTQFPIWYPIWLIFYSHAIDAIFYDYLIEFHSNHQLARLIQRSIMNCCITSFGLYLFVFECFDLIWSWMNSLVFRQANWHVLPSPVCIVETPVWPLRIVASRCFFISLCCQMNASFLIGVQFSERERRGGKEGRTHRHTYRGKVYT